MRKKIILSLVLAMVMVFSITIPLLAIDRSARESTLPYEYQVEWQEEHYRYLVELSDFSDEFQDIMLRMGEVDAYILDVISQMRYEGYEVDIIAERITIILDKYMWPLISEMMDDGITPFSQERTVEVTRRWMNRNPNYSIPTSIGHVEIINNRIYAGDLSLVSRNSFHVEDGEWFHIGLYRGRIRFVSFHS